MVTGLTCLRDPSKQQPPELLFNLFVSEPVGKILETRRQTPSRMVVKRRRTTRSVIDNFGNGLSDVEDKLLYRLITTSLLVLQCPLAHRREGVVCFAPTSRVRSDGQNIL